MIKNSIRKMLSVIGVFVLIAAMALNFTGCGSKTPAQPAPKETTAQTQATQQTEAEKTTFTLVVADLDGNETTVEITTDKEYVGEALLEQGIITGDMGDYGLYINTVNGLAADWDKDMTYWSFYIDGEYAMTGVDTTPIEETRVYSLVLTKG